MKRAASRWDPMPARSVRARLELRKLTRAVLYGPASRVVLGVLLFAAGVRVGAELTADAVVVVSPPDGQPGPATGEAVAQAAAPPPAPAPARQRQEGPLTAPGPDPCRPGQQADGASPEPAVPEPELKPLDLNTATVEQLDGLPGIGPVLAKRIVEFRQQHGPFAMVEDLVEVPGIGPRTLERLRPLIRVGDP